LAAVVPLQQLQRLDLTINMDTADAVARMAQLPAMQHLALGYTRLGLAAATAHVWRQLPQMQELRVEEDLYYHVEGSAVQQMRSILAGIAAAASLTRLDLYSWSLADGQMRSVSMADIAVCLRLTGLLCLQHLHLRVAVRGSDPCAAQALTALTGLTHLDLARSCDLVDTGSRLRWHATSHACAT
jgi:hypothetical protein